MSKKCWKCKVTYSSEFNYCPKCANMLQEEEHSYSSDITSSSNSSSYNLPDGYVYDYGGHLRPDPDQLREEKQRSEEAFRNRW
jgi:hypothetical protein